MKHLLTHVVYKELRDEVSFGKWENESYLVLIWQPITMKRYSNFYETTCEQLYSTK